jgi:hypothetical protein
MGPQSVRWVTRLTTLDPKAPVVLASAEYQALIGECAPCHKLFLVQTGTREGQCVYRSPGHRRDHLFVREGSGFEQDDVELRKLGVTELGSGRRPKY